MRSSQVILAAILLMLTSIPAVPQGQRGAMPASSKHIVYGDIKVSQGAMEKPVALDIRLFNEYGNEMSRQRVSVGGRYRFIDIADGRYYIVVEYEATEIDRFTIDFSSQYKSDIQKDIELQSASVTQVVRAAVISAADNYNRGAKTSATFSRATNAAKEKHYDEAVTLFRQVVETDAADHQAWYELGTAYFAQKNFAEAEKAYTQAIAKHPNYFVALLSLGRLRIAQKNFDGAIEVLTKAVQLQPTSAQANYFLGEAYLQNKKGSLAVGYLNEAIKLDPVGMADAHLRLAALYNAVGMKDKAAIEYEEFLKKVPSHPDKKKLQEYITANKKP